MSLKLTGGSEEQALKARERKRHTMEMQRYGMREEGEFLLEAKRADRPIKSWPLLTPVTSPGKPLAHSHTCYNCLYRPEAGKRERGRENVKRKYMHVFFHTAVLHTWAKKGEGWTYFYTIKWKCNSREKIERFEQTLFMRFPIPTCSVALQVLNLDRKTASRGSAHRFFCQRMLTEQWTCLSHESGLPQSFVFSLSTRLSVSHTFMMSCFTQTAASLSDDITSLSVLHSAFH